MQNHPKQKQLGLTMQDLQALQSLSEQAKSFLYYATNSLINNIIVTQEAMEKHQLNTNDQTAFYETIKSYGSNINARAFDAGQNKTLIKHFN